MVIKNYPVHFKMSISWEAWSSPLELCAWADVHMHVLVYIPFGVGSRRKLPPHVTAPGKWVVLAWEAQTCRPLCRQPSVKDGNFAVPPSAWFCLYFCLTPGSCWLPLRGWWPRESAPWRRCWADAAQAQIPPPSLSSQGQVGVHPTALTPRLPDLGRGSGH